MFQAVEYDEMRENLLQKPDIVLDVPRTVEEIYEDKSGVTLLCEGKRYRKGKMPPLFVQDDLALLPDKDPDKEQVRLLVRIETFSEGTVRVRLLRPEKEKPAAEETSHGDGDTAAKGQTVRKASTATGDPTAARHPTVARRVKEMQVAEDPVEGLMSSHRQDEEGNTDTRGRYLILETNLVRIVVDTEDWNLRMGPAAGGQASDGQASGRNSSGGQVSGREASGVDSRAYPRPIFAQYTRDEHSIDGLVSEQTPSHQESFDSFESFPFALGFDPETGKEFWTDAVEISYDEHFYGFGEKFGPFDKLGQEVLLWHCDALSVSSAKSYKNVPFFISSAGYGLYVNSSAKCRFLMGSYHYKAYQMICHEGEVDYFFIYGPSVKEILPRYTDITGKAAMLPEWSFGTWISKNTYHTQEELLSVAKEVRRREIPCDVIHLDVGWFEEEWMCDYEFSKERFPDPKGMTEELRRLGFRLSIWQLPYFKQQNKLYPELKERGLLATRPDGRVSTPEADGVLDLSNPEAVEWYKSKLKQLFDKGVSVIKVDFGESSEEEARYYRYDGSEMHNLYPFLYNRIAYEITEKETGEGIIWARSAWAGSQRYPLHWGGDSATDFHGMYHSLRGGLSFGLSGFSFWSHDVGGYFGTPDADVYIRWAQMGLFSSHMRMHGTSSREPWKFGEEIEAIFVEYARLRYRLLPYIWREARRAAENSLPMLRALLIEFSEDPSTWNIDDQYLFGESILVAPVFSRRPVRNVYLPAGARWYDFWTDELYEGGQWVQKEVPLDTLPLYIRAGSIIEAGPEISHTGEKSIESLDLHYYPDFSEAVSEKIEVSEQTLAKVYGNGKLSARVLVHGQPADAVVVKGVEEIRPATGGLEPLP